MDNAVCQHRYGRRSGLARECGGAGSGEPLREIGRSVRPIRGLTRSGALLESASFARPRERP
ncbi:hypothetical protein DV532_13530 [Pseudomonas sp. Leaf58]|nr:hypothetical protein DV532_13530 [Pseudomonas sp. Leaf58]